ncbi:nucleotidyl transferase AbiEii/AbiGii toxin family protein [Filimonas effusa]|uniref:Nucleotidyl transferase AbiEii/AbiGii toxin family protein n=1 Tax=Filimonas effusa TaxID=2508721 RepID=A0A4Q1CZH4_9BACT|nr:nucleotidyl transferase AbiEii/AbiGii toxin family protein [Filimonas effusa]RXK80807.1 hypothetical protein ESB13_21860 [Filimonas effusa]
MSTVDAVSTELRQTLTRLQALPSLQGFGLAGGTNLALRFNHRESIDLDLFSGQMVGQTGMEYIMAEIEKEFNASEIRRCILENVEEGEQFGFIRLLLAVGAKTIKVEIIQNAPLLDEFDIVEGYRLVSVKDIGHLKLMSISSRAAQKDLYDLDLITDKSDLGTLMEALAEKEARFTTQADWWLFDLDEPTSPTADYHLLLAADPIDYKPKVGRPYHSTDALNIIPPNKDIKAAKRQWRRKVFKLMRDNGVESPKLGPVN